MEIIRERVVIVQQASGLFMVQRPPVPQVVFALGFGGGAGSSTLPPNAATESTLATRASEATLAIVAGKLPLDPLLARLRAADQLTGEEYPADQAGANGVLTFTYAAAPDLVWVRSVGGISRATLSTVQPTATSGVYCGADEPTPITCSGKTLLKVWAPVGATVSTWGFRYT